MSCSFYLSGFRRPVHPLLKILASGPVQTTAYAQGIIIPRLVYSHQNIRIIMENEKFNTEDISVDELLSQFEGDSKIISELNHDASNISAISMVNTTTLSSVNLEKPVSTLELQLSPPYQPMKRVPEVWNSRYQQQNFERTVFPPGFIDI